MLTIKNMTTSILLLVAIGLSTWSMLLMHPTSSPQTQQNPNNPDSIMQDVEATIFSKEGKPALQLVTPKMVHYAKDNLMRITTPNVTIYRKSPQPWRIHSESASAKNGIDDILFWNHVEVHHAADSDNPMMSLHTHSLHIFPEKKLASTDEAVTFIQPDTTVHAIGMIADLDDGTIKLLSQAQGVYAPTS